MDRAHLAAIADAVIARQGKVLDLRGKRAQPRHVHLLRTPMAFVDDIVSTLSDDGTAGDPLPWPKTHRLFRLRPSEVTLWGGGNGASKSTVLSEVALALAVAGQRVVVLSLEMPVAKLAARMVRQAFAARQPVRSRVVRWSEQLEDALAFLDLVGDVDPNDVIELARYCAAELRTQHFVLDNLTKVLSADNEHAELQRRFMAVLCRIAMDSGMHVHVVAHTRKPPGRSEDEIPSRYEIAGSRTLSDQADNVVMVWRNRPKEAKQAAGDRGIADQPDVVLLVDKQRWGSWEGQITLWMDREAFRFVEHYADRAQPMLKD